MAKARMLHKKISVSAQVNKLSLQSRLLFSWMIVHADDEGRLKGEPEYIKAIVVPMTKWSFKSIQKCLEDMKAVGLTHYWEENNERFIEFVKWNDHQSIRKDRFIPSTLPSFNKDSDNQLTTNGRPEVNQGAPQDNITEDNKIEENISEVSKDSFAIKDSYKRSVKKTDPNFFSPLNEIEYAALEAWRIIEADNPDSFDFYLWAARNGLPSTKFFEFSSEVKQDPTIRNKGAVFNKKVQDYLRR